MQVARTKSEGFTSRRPAMYSHSFFAASAGVFSSLSIFSYSRLISIYMASSCFIWSIPNKVSVEICSACTNGTISDVSGSPASDSHRLTAWAVTPICIASSSCVNPIRFLAIRILFPNIIFNSS